MTVDVAGRCNQGRFILWPGLEVTITRGLVLDCIGAARPCWNKTDGVAPGVLVWAKLFGNACGIRGTGVNALLKGACEERHDRFVGGVHVAVGDEFEAAIYCRAQQS